LVGLGFGPAFSLLPLDPRFGLGCGRGVFSALGPAFGLSDAEP
jgi:hypothetical protein